MRILAYIESPPGKGLLYRKHGYVSIYVYSYVEDKGDKKSTNIYLQFVGLVTW